MISPKGQRMGTELGGLAGDCLAGQMLVQGEAKGQPSKEAISR